MVATARAWIHSAGTLVWFFHKLVSELQIGRFGEFGLFSEVGDQVGVALGTGIRIVLVKLARVAVPPLADVEHSVISTG